ncbi:MAG: tetratricopeptide repeat protein, partial [Bacteroidota bacterium]
MKYILPLFLALCLTFFALPDAWGQKTAKLAYKAAETLRKQNKCQQAVLKYDEAIREDSDNYTYHFQKGRCQYSLGRYDDAITSFKETLKYKENFANAFAWLARAYKNKNDMKTAATYFKLAARHESRSNIQLQYYLLLINILLDQNELEETRKYITAAKDLAPQNPNVIFYEAELAAKEKRWTAAEKAYEKALASEEMQSISDSRKAKYYYGLGLAKSQLGDKKGAQEAWKKAKFGPYTRLVAQQQKQN